MSIIEDLRKALVGKTVEAVEETYRPDIACVVRCLEGTKKTAFTLWTGCDGSLNVGSDEPEDVGDLFDRVFDYRQYGDHPFRVSDDAMPLPRLEIKDDQISIDAGDGTKFSLGFDRIDSEWERRVFRHPEAVLFVPDLVELTHFWKTHFLKKNSVPGLPSELLVDTIDQTNL